jgi:signal transduction histidine kinase
MTEVAAWLLVLGLTVLVQRLWRRLELVAQAAHELRGPLTAVGYAVATLRREAGGVRRALRLESELERMRIGLEDLDAARNGRRAPARPRPVRLERAVERAAASWRPAVGADRGVQVRWEAGRALVNVDRARLAQALGNVMANAVEHGSGPIDIRAVRRGKRSVRVEVSNSGPPVRLGRRTAPGRGRGLGIASRAVREAGGTLELDRRSNGTTATIELPLADDHHVRS